MREVIGALLAACALAAPVWAAQPTQADVEACNREAAQMAAESQKARPGGEKVESNTPKDAARGGSVTEDRQPGTFPFGMAPAGRADTGYRQTYVACLARKAR